VSLRNLSTYRRKRDFEKTAEPSGEVAVAPSKHRRFVIQKHDATRLHYDLRLEFDGVFKSWAVTRGPSLDPHDRRLAVEVEDHPLDYGDFEGAIPKGQYGGGTVMLWDRGTWVPFGDVDEGLRKGSLKFALHGEKLHGHWALVRMAGKFAKQAKPSWLLIKERDGDELTARRTAADGLADLAQWDQLGWTESDSLKAFLGAKEAAAAVAKGLEKAETTGASTGGTSTLTALQWEWRALEARRQSRNLALDIRLLNARLSGQ